MGTKRKRRARGRHEHVELSDALRHFLQCGWTGEDQFASRRLPGWLRAAATLVTEPEALEAVWLQHRDELVAEATRHGFESAALCWFTEGGLLREDADDVTAGDPAREKWSKAFCVSHGY